MKEVRLLIILLVLTKIVSAQRIEPGVFIGENTHKKMIFNKDKSYLFLNPSTAEPVFGFRDTLTKGAWRQENNIITINSSNFILKDTLVIKVEERQKYSSDSIYFEIHNPIEDAYTEKEKNVINLLQYHLYAQEGHSWQFKEYAVKANYGFDRKMLKGMQKFRLAIFPNPVNFWSGLDFSSFYTTQYTLVNNSSNHFIINIPNLTTRFILYKRFVGEHVKVISANIIEWENERFIKARMKDKDVK